MVINKRGSIETKTLVEIILLIGFLIIMAGIIIANYVTTEELKEFACWASNGIKSSNIFSRSFDMPTTCELANVEEPVDKQQLSKMLKKAWTIYGKGDWNFGKEDREIAVYYFSVKEDISYEQLINYMVYNKDGKPATDLTDTDYNFIEKGSEGRTICTGRHVGDADNGETAILKKSTETEPHNYFIMFWDDTIVDIPLMGEQGKEQGDKLVIAGKPQLGQEGKYYCWSAIDRTKRLEITTDGYWFGSKPGWG